MELPEKKCTDELLLWFEEKKLYQNQLLDIFNIEELDFCYEDIQDYPAPLGKLKQIKRVCLALNRLDQVPEFIYELDNLETLELDMNEFSVLPHSLGNINHLKKLLLGYNNLYDLPDIFDRMEKLEYLDLTMNSLLTLPDSMESLNHLEYLNLSGNKQLLIPQWLWKSSSLKKLIISKEMKYPKIISSLSFDVEVTEDD